MSSTAAAPIETKILSYFASINLPILEVFGQSECSGPHTCNTHEGWKIGTVGRPLPGTTTRIDPNTGEMVYGGRHVFAGYMDMEEKTMETIDSEGFLHSGDIVKVRFIPLLLILFKTFTLTVPKIIHMSAIIDGW